MITDVLESGSGSSNTGFQQFLQIRFRIWHIFARFLPDSIASLACLTQ
jgi:hypothetical protein